MDYLILILFGACGLRFWFAPTESLLKNDYGWGKIYWWRAKDKKAGLNKAREYYNKLGKVFVFFSITGIAIKLIFAWLQSST